MKRPAATIHRTHAGWPAPHAGPACAGLVAIAIALSACGAQQRGAQASRPSPSVQATVAAPLPTPSPALEPRHEPGPEQLIVEETSIWRVRVSDADQNGAVAAGHGRLFYGGGKDGADLMVVEIGSPPAARRIASATAGYEIVALAESSDGVVMLEEHDTIGEQRCQAMACVPDYDARLRVRVISPDGTSDRLVASLAYTRFGADDPLLASSEGLWAIAMTPAGRTTTEVQVRDDSGRLLWKTTTAAPVDELMLGGNRLALVSTEYQDPTLVGAVYVAELDEPGLKRAGTTDGGAALSQDGRYLALIPVDGECRTLQIIDLDDDSPGASPACLAGSSVRWPSVSTGAQGPVAAWDAQDSVSNSAVPIATLSSPLLDSSAEVPCSGSSFWFWVEGDSFMWISSGEGWLEWAGFDLTTARYRIV
jgi:hypothetical protein